MSLVGELRTVLGERQVLAPDAPGARAYLHDATESRAIRGWADAIILPSTAEQVAGALSYCYAHDVPLTPRGGGTGFAGGCVPDGGVLLSLERLGGPARVEPEYWRAWAPAGAITGAVRRRARENGLYYPPDPGSAESSTIGGNIATNAGGPHTFKYGVTGHWVTGLDVVLAPGELVTIGGTARKDVGGYDLRALLVGSEGTLGIVTGAWLRLVPAPPVALPVVGLYPTIRAGVGAITAAMTSGAVPAALEYLDGATLESASAGLAAVAPELRSGATEAAMMVIAEADGSEHEADALREALSEGALAVHAPRDPREIAALWRWRDEVSVSVTARRGGKVSEDIVVPLQHLAEAIEATLEIGARHGLPACSWGHAGDGNLHATMMIHRGDPDQLRRAQAAGHELFALAARLGGAVSGEHGLGTVKNGALGLQWPDRTIELHEGIKRLLDPKGLLNPGKKLAR